MSGVANLDNSVTKYVVSFKMYDNVDFQCNRDEGLLN